MPTIIPRSFWGPRYDDGDIPLSGPALEVFVHHTVTATLSENATQADEVAQMRSLEATGQTRFGHGISYNVLVFPSGRAYQGVSFNRRGAHTDGRNSTTRSICFVGNFEEHQPTQAALETARSIYHSGKGSLWVEDAPLYGHRDLKATACPGRHVYAQLPFLRTPPMEGILSMLSDNEQRELLSKVRDLHGQLHGLQVPMPWKDKKGKNVKYTLRSALSFIAQKVNK